MFQNYGSAHIKRRKLNTRLITYAALGGVMALCLAVFWLVRMSGVFTVKAITIEGALIGDEASLIGQLKRQVIGTTAGKFFGVENYFGWSTGLTYSDIKYKGIEIAKDISGRTITVTATPRERVIAWCDQTTETICYWTDETGIAFETAPIPEGQLVLRVDDVRAEGTPPLLGNTVILPAQFEVVKKILRGLGELAIRFNRATLNRELQELRVSTLAGAQLVFSTRFDPTATALPAVERFRQSPGLANIKSVDLTVENRAFLKQ